MKEKILFTSLLAAMPLVAEIKVLTFAGSTRSDSYNKKLATEAAEMAREMGGTVTYIDLRDYPIPFYDGDLEAKEGMPENAKRLRKLMIQSDVILIATPEYNGSLSAILKNAIDWASRSEDGKTSRACFEGKKFGIMSATPGAKGGASALGHLRFILERLGGEVVSTQLSVGGAFNLTPEKEQLKKETMKAELEQILQPLVAQKSSFRNE